MPLFWNNSSNDSLCSHVLPDDSLHLPSTLAVAKALTPGPQMSQLISEGLEKPSQRLGLRGE